MAHLYISAAHKSSGKTVIAAGICAAIRAAGITVQPFKKGPDYIDPMWLSRAAGRACRNLDFFTMSRSEIIAACNRHGSGAGLNLIEGTKGLHDGVAVDGSDSNAALSKLLSSPVVLVVDSRGLTRGVAPLIEAQSRFDEGVRTSGVILNRVGGPRHENKLRAAIERYTDIPVLGAVSDNKALMISEGHLGLLPANDHPQAARVVESLGKAVRAQVDLDRILDIAREARFPAGNALNKSMRCGDGAVRVGVARDAAFGFYYPEDLEGLRTAGAELRFFDTLCDKSLPEVDAVFIGGGFPERHMDALAANAALRHELKTRINDGMPAYAECGGLMYLTRSIEWKGRRAAMVGAIEADAVMHERPRGRGYVKLRETGKGPWPLLERDHAERIIFAHEFHYSDLENCASGVDFAYEVIRGRGVDGSHDGIVVHNLLANFSHLRNVAAHSWTQRFVAFIRSRQKRRAPAEALSSC